MKANSLKSFKSMVGAALLFMAVCVIPMLGMAQESNPLIVVDLMKVEPENASSYVEIEQNIWKPIHQERIKKGLIVGWVMYEVMYAGSDDPYNYVTVNVYANPPNLENPYQGMVFKDIHPDKDLNAEMEKTAKLRKVTRSQLMSRSNFAYPEGAEGTADYQYIVVNYMKTLPGGNFMQLEEELAKPVSQQLIKNGNWAGWTVWSNVFPRGSVMESDVVTVDYYPDFSTIGTVNYRGAFEQAHPGKDWSEFTQKVGSSRNMVRSELWKLIDYAFAEQ